MRNWRLRALAGAPALAFLTNAPTTLAAEPAITAASAIAAEPDEVVVTARRRAEPLATTPVSAVVFTRADLARLQPATVIDLARGVAGVRLDPVGPQGRSGQFAIRGINYGSTNQAGDPSVPLYVDGVYQSRSNLAALRQFDLQGAEILRGPQVTYLGRNAFAGAVALRTRQPGRELQREVEWSMGSHGLVRWQAAIDLPLPGEQSALRLAATGARSAGLHRSLQTPDDSLGGENLTAARVTWQARLAEQWLVTVKAERLRERSDPSPLRNASTSPATATPLLPAQALGSIAGFPPNHPAAPLFRTEVFVPPGQRSFVDQDALTLSLSRPLAGGVLDFTGAYQRTDDSVIVDPAAVGFAVNNQYFVTDVRMGSQELRWLGEVRPNWQLLLGAHHMHDAMDYGNITYSTHVPLLGSNAQVMAAQHRRSSAVFAEVEWRPAPAWRLNLAGRLMREDKTFRFVRTLRPAAAGIPPGVFLEAGPAATRSARWNNFSPKVSIDYTSASRGLWFVSWTRAFKSGGFAVQVPSIGFAGPFDPERVETVEAGWRFADDAGNWSGSLTAFTNHLEDLQRSINRTNGGVLGNLVVNAAAAKTQGVELEAAWRPTPAQQWTLSAARLEARYLRYCANTGFPGGLSGLVRGSPCSATVGEFDSRHFPIANAPEWQASLGWRWAMALAGGKLEIGGQVTHTASLFTTDVPFPISRRGPLTLVDAGLGWATANDRWQLRLDLRNALDEVDTLQGIRSGNTLTVLALTPPRTVQFTAGTRF